MAAPLPGSCGYYVEKKRRFCKMVAARGRRFCGEHATMEADSSRITCPLDPKHTVSADKLEKHLKKCNSRRKPTPAYYVENINSGPAGEEEDIQEVSLSELSHSQLDTLLERLKTAARGLPQEVEEGVLSHPALQDELQDPRNGGSAHKHLEQQSSILGHLQALGLLGRGRCFVEFGAGRGKLSHWIHEALKAPQQQQDVSPKEPAEDLQLLLVERSSTRFKVDGKHQQGDAILERLQVDIQHLDLAKIPLLQQKRLPLVAVGKHLCGAATDLALRCLLGPPQLDPHHHQGEPPTKRLKAAHPGGGGAEPPEGVVAPPAGGGDCAPGVVLGLVVALCCHHRCQWRHYVGQSFFRRRGLGAADFLAFCRMSSWATCGLRPANHRPAGRKDTAANQRRVEEEEEEEEEEDDHDVVEMPEVVSRFEITQKTVDHMMLCCPMGRTPC